jgi:signal transduction histidine kinase
MSDAPTARLREDVPVATLSPDPGPAAPTGPTGPAGPARIGPVSRVLRETGYAISAFPLAWFFFCLVVTGLSLSAGLIVLLGGVLVLSATVYLARGNAVVERLRLRDLLLRPVRMPAYLTPRRDQGFWRRATGPLRDPQSWLDLLWSLVSPITASIAFVVAVSWWAAALGGLSYWFWQRYIPYSPDEHGLAWALGFGNGRTAESWTDLVVGILFALTLPLAIRAATLLHSGLARLMLCSRAELQHEVAQVTRGRDAAREAEATSLRRLERDIHDGPQQRLVRLTMDLGRARHRLAEDPEGAAAIIDGALAQAQETVAELRSLSRGVAPPLLVDRGLEAAVAEMLGQSPVPVTAHVDVPEGLAPHVETAAYFVVAEAMTNVAKHSGASSATVNIVRAGDQLQIGVGDDGVGGAHLAKGLGLAGLRQRLAAVDGTLHVDSPVGGPTIVVASIPLGSDT